MRVPAGWRVYWQSEGTVTWPIEAGWYFAPTDGPRPYPRVTDWGLVSFYAADPRPSRGAALRALRRYLQSTGWRPTRSPEDVARAPLRGWLLLLMKTKCARDYWAAERRFLLW